MAPYVHLAKVLCRDLPDVLKLRACLPFLRQYFSEVHPYLSVFRGDYCVRELPPRFLPSPVMAPKLHFRFMQPRVELLIVIPDQVDRFFLSRFLLLDTDIEELFFYKLSVISKE